MNDVKSETHKLIDLLVKSFNLSADYIAEQEHPYREMESIFREVCCDFYLRKSRNVRVASKEMGITQTHFPKCLGIPIKLWRESNKEGLPAKPIHKLARGAQGKAKSKKTEQQKKDPLFILFGI